jgi:hypothetical protein
MKIVYFKKYIIFKIIYLFENYIIHEFRVQHGRIRIIAG